MTHLISRRRRRPVARTLARPLCCASLLLAGACGHPPRLGPALEHTESPDAGAAGPLDAGTPARLAPPLPAVCSSAGWCWDTPGLQGNALRAVAARSATDVWAVGSLGLLMHSDGASWSARWAPTQKTLRGLWLGEDELWAVGDEGSVWRYAADTWSAVELSGLEPRASLRGVAGSGARLWIVGDGGSLYERRDGNWARVDVGTTAALNAIWAGGAEAWAVGDGGIVLHFAADAWTRVDAGTGRKLTSVHGRGREVWLGGEAGELRRWNGEDERWERPESEGTPPRGDVLSLQVAAQELLYAASSDGNVYVWDGAASCPVEGDAGATEPCAKWAPARSTGKELPIFGLWASGEQSLAVGEYGLVVEFQGRERRVLGQGSLDNYQDVSGSGAEDVWVAGDRLLSRSSDNSWKEIPRDSPRAVYSLQVPRQGQVLVAGTGGMARSYSGSSWADMDVRADALLRGLFSGSTGAWMVGSRGQAFGLLNERLWAPLTTPTDRDLLAVWSSAAGTAWAVGEGGVILRHDGIGWAAIPSGPQGGVTVDLRGVWGTRDDDVWSVGTGGTALHWDGRVWTRSTPEAAFALNDIWGRSQGDAWAVGSGGTILHYDGESWQSEPSGSEHTLNAIWGSGDRVWAVGEHGTILVKRLE